MKVRFSSLILYFCICSFILGWWALAFNNTHFTTYPQISHTTTASSLSIQTSSLFPFLSPMPRDALHEALSGNFELMAQFIANWDVDAQILETRGVKDVQRLHPEALLQANILSRLMLESSPERFANLNRIFRSKTIRDDLGHNLNVDDWYNKFFPQTYVSASILLAIAKTKEIVSIPRGMRDLTQIYASSKLEKISRNLDGYYSERLFLTRPHLCFISPYSHPPTVDALRRQGLELCVINNINTLQDIQETILKIGHASNHPLEASLLSIFMEACLLSVDNRIKSLQKQNSKKTLLYLCEKQGYMVPTTKCLAGQLLKRALQHYPALTCSISENQQDWFIPIEKEKIIRTNPDYLIISTPHYQAVQNQLPNHQVFKQPICYLDENLQGSPTQYIALAYFDIFQALANIHTQ